MPDDKKSCKYCKGTLKLDYETEEKSCEKFLVKSCLNCGAVLIETQDGDDWINPILQ